MNDFDSVEPSMRVNTTAERYGIVAMTLHWTIAALVLANFFLGLGMDDVPVSQLSHATIDLHGSIGLTILCLSLLRILWRLLNPVPSLPKDLTPFFSTLVRVIHLLFYFLIILIPLSGWMMVSAMPASGPISYFGVFHWPQLPYPNDSSVILHTTAHELFQNIHVYLAGSLLILVPLHVSGAFYHQFIRGDDVFMRILPRRSK